MEELEKVVRRIYLKKGHKSKYFDESSVVWDERIEIVCDKMKKLKSIEYAFFRVDPILGDGYKYEIGEALEREGWGVGLLGLTYKENIPFSKLPECMAFKEAYKETYESIIEKAERRLPDSEQQRAIFTKHPYTISEFLEMVKEKFEELKKKMPKIEQKELDLLQLDRFLRAQGFELYKEEWYEENQEV